MDLRISLAALLLVSFCACAEPFDKTDTHIKGWETLEKNNYKRSKADLAQSCDTLGAASEEECKNLVEDLFLDPKSKEDLKNSLKEAGFPVEYSLEEYKKVVLETCKALAKAEQVEDKPIVPEKLPDLYKVGGTYKKGQTKSWKLSTGLATQLGDAILKINPKLSIEKANELKELVLNLHHGAGVGIAGGIAAGAGVKMGAEMVMHEKELALFCAPALQAATELGPSAEAYGLKTFGCNKNADYSGGFLNLGAGVNLTALGLPVSLGGTLSLGMNTEQFTRDSKNALLDLKNVLLDPSKMAAFIGLVKQGIRSDEFSESPGVRLGMQLLVTLIKSASDKSDAMLIKDLEGISADLRKASISEDKLEKKPEVTLPEILAKAPQFKFLADLLQAFNRNLTGCNSFSVAVGGKMESPIAGSGSYAHYTKIAGVDLSNWIPSVSLDILNASRPKNDFGCYIKKANQEFKLAQSGESKNGGWNGFFNGFRALQTNRLLKTAQLMAYFSNPSLLAGKCATNFAVDVYKGIAP